MSKFKDIFKSELDPDDIINNEEPIRLDINTESNIEPENVKTPIPIPLHLRKAADEELRRALKGGWLEPVHHATTWCDKRYVCEETYQTWRRNQGEVGCRFSSNKSDPPPTRVAP